MDNREILTRFKSGALDRQQVLALLTGNGQAPAAPAPSQAPVPAKALALSQAPVAAEPPPPPADGCAVVAVDCAFPGAAAGTAGFWEAALGAAPAGAGDTAPFDPALLRIGRDEADALHPEERLLLHRVHQALEGAGYAGARLDTLTGPDGEHRAVGVFTATTRPHTSALLSRVLDLRGPSRNTDTGDSSFLTAVHQALGALRTGECAAALVAGGDEREGVAVLLLRPSAAARAAGDRVHAVLTASAAGHPGRGTSALRERLRQRVPPTAPGLDEEGTGAAALVRAVLQLRHGVLLPGPGRERPGPWPEGPRTALAGVYEDDAPYAAVALREPPPAPPEPAEEDGPHLVLLSAPTPRHLAATAVRLADWLTSFEQAPGPGAVARELRIGRAVHACRLAVVVHDTAELAGALAAFARGDAASGPRPVRHADLREAGEPLLADGLPETRDYLAALWRGRRFEQLTRLWLAGADVPAGDRTGPPAPVLELPTSAPLPDTREARRAG
ncbi:beta-ketoacyl synthase N-terminal-like domain-containing protein [Streptomyces sp. NPDC007259]|uniref:beta-ketoacyl synthase N-terminal-like domain-containing protein n=1 Tax=Streptomyces sp. NPDC007259 TaxID=3154319 RepID=UPI0034521EFC